MSKASLFNPNEKKVWPPPPPPIALVDLDDGNPQAKAVVIMRVTIKTRVDEGSQREIAAAAF